MCSKSSPHWLPFPHPTFHFVNQILELAHNKREIASRVHATIENYAERGLRALGVARQVKSFLPLNVFSLCFLTIFLFTFQQDVPDGNKDSPGGPWEMVGLLPLFDPPRHDSAETIKNALKLGVNVKMITGGFQKLIDF